MKPFTTPNSNQVLPLEKLVKISRGKVYVPVGMDLLPRIDLSKLQRTLRFTVDHHFKADISFSVDAHTRNGHVQMSITPDLADWPEPTDIFREMYCMSLAIAAKMVAEKVRPRRRLYEFVLSRRSNMLAEYCISLPNSGSELLDFIYSKLDAIHEELPSVNERFMHGPVPGTTPEVAEDVDEPGD